MEQFTEAFEGVSWQELWLTISSNCGDAAAAGIPPESAPLVPSVVSLLFPKIKPITTRNAISPPKIPSRSFKRLLGRGGVSDDGVRLIGLPPIVGTIGAGFDGGGSGGWIALPHSAQNFASG